MFEQIWLWIFLFSLFLSSLITRRVMARVKVKQAIGSTLARSLGVFAVIYLPLVDQPRLSDSVILPVVGIILVLSGITLIILASKELAKTKFITTRPLVFIPEKLITTGPYRFVRHPANVGSVSFFVGWSLTWGALYCLCLIAPTLIITLVIESFLEERNLEKVFGDEYQEYRRRVGMFLPKTRRRERS